MKEFIDKTVTIRLGHIFMVISFVFSLAVAAGAYKSAFDTSVSEIKNLSGEMRSLREAVIRLEERLGAIERYGK